MSDEYEIQPKICARVLKKTPPTKLVRLFILKEVKPSPEHDGKMIKLLTFHNLFPPLRHSRKNSQ